MFLETTGNKIFTHYFSRLLKATLERLKILNRYTKQFGNILKKIEKEPGFHIFGDM